MTIRVLAVDAHMLLRLGLRYAIADCPDIGLVGEARTGSEALEVAAACRPDVVTVALVLPDGDGITVAQQLRTSAASLGVVLLSAVEDRAVMLRALRAGLSAYVTKSASTDVVLTAIRHAAVAPHAFTSPHLDCALRDREESTGLLSRREREVLELMRDGRSLPAIAEHLCVGSATVKTYVSRIYEKLQVNNRTQALLAGLERGLLGDEVDTTWEPVSQRKRG